MRCAEGERRAQNDWGNNNIGTGRWLVVQGPTLSGVCLIHPRMSGNMERVIRVCPKPGSNPKWLSEGWRLVCEAIRLGWCAAESEYSECGHRTWRDVQRRAMWTVP